ncbi:MAG: hypothetical protein K2I49_00485 [Ureaplasma sp.]|nr:hypothetical protein [Ureaplasma sp.]
MTKKSENSKKNQVKRKNTTADKVKKIQGQISELSESNEILKKKIQQIEDTNSAINEQRNQELQKAKVIKKKKIAYGVTFGLIGAIAVGLSIGLPIAMTNKIINQATLILFTDWDISNLRQKIIEKVNSEKLSEPALAKYAMTDLFKNELTSSRKNIGNLIVNVEVTNYSTNSITFQVTLTLDKDKYDYQYDGSNSNIKISDNILSITYEGTNSITFEGENNI